MKEVILSEDLVDEIIQKSLNAQGQQNIAKELQISLRQVRKVLASPAYKTKLKELVEQDVEAARNRIRIRMAKAETEILEAFFSLLRDGGEKSRVEAVKLGLRVLDVDRQEDTSSGGNLIVHLPGQRTENVVEVQKEISDDSVENT